MCDMRHPVSIVSPLWQWLRKKFTLIYTWLIFSSSYSIFFYHHLKNINQNIRKKKKKKNRKKTPLRGFSLRRYVVTRYAVTRFTNNLCLILVIRHLTALASTGTFCFSCLLFFLLRFFLLEIRFCRITLEK